MKINQGTRRKKMRKVAAAGALVLATGSALVGGQAAPAGAYTSCYGASYHEHGGSVDELHYKATQSVSWSNVVKRGKQYELSGCGFIRWGYSNCN